MQDIADRPLAWRVGARQVPTVEREALQRLVPRFELLRVLEVADDLAVLGIRGHPVPGCRREGWRAGFDDRMEPLGQPAIWFRHRGDLREHGALPVRRVRLQLLGALLHRGSFLVRESLELLADRGGAPGGLLRALLCRFPLSHSASDRSWAISLRHATTPCIAPTRSDRDP